MANKTDDNIPILYTFSIVEEQTSREKVTYVQISEIHLNLAHLVSIEPIDSKKKAYILRMVNGRDYLVDAFPVEDLFNLND